MSGLDKTLQDLDIFHGFIRRHIGNSPGEEAAMLAELDLECMDELLDRVVPERKKKKRGRRDYFLTTFFFILGLPLDACPSFIPYFCSICCRNCSSPTGW